MTNYPYSAYGPDPYSGNVNADNGWGGYKWPGGVPGSLLTSFDVPAAGGSAHLTFRSELVELVRLSFQIAAKHGYPIYAVHNGEVWGPWSYENRAISGSSVASNHSRGRAWDINAPCLAAGTQVVTTDGPAAIETLVGREVEVLTTDGSPLTTQEPVWRKTTFRSYGVAPTFDVVLSRRSTRTTVRTTADHRWFTHRSHQGRPGGRAWREVKTSGLGGLISTERILSAEYPPLAEPLDPTAVARGIVWGDGNVGNANRPNPVSVVELVGDKYLDLRKWLEPHARSWHNGSAGPRAWGLPLVWKRELPDPASSVSVLAGFTAGWLATDGTVSTGGQVSVSTSDERAVVWLLRIAPRIGLCVSTVKRKRTTGYGGKANTEVFFTPRSVSVDLLIRPHHLNRFTNPRRDGTLAGWGVESVTPTGISEEVFCASVDGSGAFALHTGGVPLLTGNSNPYHDPLISDIPPAMVHDFESVGWAWGGRYNGRKDAMHFEYGYAPSDVAGHVAKAKIILGGTTLPPEPAKEWDELVTEAQFDAKLSAALAPLVKAVTEIQSRVRGTDTAPGQRHEQRDMLQSIDATASDLWGWTRGKDPVVDSLTRLKMDVGDVKAGVEDLVGNPPPVPTPPDVPTTYTVLQGDTLSGIAAKYGKTVDDLKLWNQIADANAIGIGQVIRLGP